jgi:hypothetical protein
VRLLALLLLVGCKEIAALEISEPDLTYEDSLSAIPTDYAMGEFPDGTMQLEDDARVPFFVTVRTNPDGSRDVTFTHQGLLMDSSGARLLRAYLGDGLIRSIVGVQLTLVSQHVDGPASAAGLGLAAIDDQLLRDHVDFPGSLVASLKRELLDDDDVTLPLSLSFHLEPGALASSISSDIHAVVEVAPTIDVGPLGDL